MKHLIKKQVINLQLPKQLDAFSVQQSVSMHYYKQVLPLIDQVFDELSVDGETVSIDHLEIDLGSISEVEMKSENWSELILSEIREQLTKAIIESAGSSLFIREKDRFAICRQWLFYMLNGYLPWNTTRVSGDWYLQVLEALAVDFSSVTALRRLIRESPFAVSRIVLQHNEEFLVSLIEILTSRNHRQLTGAIDELDLVLSMNGNSQKHSALWEQALQFSAENEKRNTDMLVTSLLLNNAGSISDVMNIISNKPSGLSIILPVLDQLENQSSLFSDHEKIGRERDTTMSEMKGVEKIDEEGVFIQNAGQVLVHPFLPGLFKKLELVSGGKFLNNEIHQKALYLMHYIATGNVSGEEFELVMPKLLCNWPIEEPVGKGIELSAGELAEADQMLEALVDHWTVLKNTSVEGLREGFLNRGGKLLRKNDQIILQVESKTIDVLLDQLPWNLSMIKLPWMKELLRVEWR
jgi:hypothetical protein